MWRLYLVFVAIGAAADRSSLERVPSRSRHPRLLVARERRQSVTETTNLIAAGEPIFEGDMEPEECKKPDGIAVFEVPFVFVAQAAAIVIAFVIALQTVVPFQGLPEMAQKVY